MRRFVIAIVTLTLVAAEAYAMFNPRAAVDRTRTFEVGLDFRFDEVNGYYFSNAFFPYTYTGAADSEFAHYSMTFAPRFSYRLGPVEVAGSLSLYSMQESLNRYASLITNTNSAFLLDNATFEARFTIVDWSLDAGLIADAQIPIGVGSTTGEPMRYRGAEEVTNETFEDVSRGFVAHTGVLIGVTPRGFPIHLHGNFLARFDKNGADYFVIREALEIIPSHIATATLGVEHILPWDIGNPDAYYQHAIFLGFDFSIYKGLGAKTAFTKTLAGLYTDNHRTLTIGLSYQW